MKICCGNCKKLDEAIEKVAYARYECKHCHKINEIVNIELSEWLGFNYKKYLDAIEAVIKKDPFQALKANTEIEKDAGYLTDNQVSKLKNTLIIGFKEGLSIKEINNKIIREVKIPALKKINTEGTGIETDAEGNDKIVINKEVRNLMITRTESTRVAAEGALQNYKQHDITEVSFLAAMSDRTCPECEELNGTIMSITEAKNKIPVHVYCRCTFIPVINS